MTTKSTLALFCLVSTLVVFSNIECKDTKNKEINIDVSKVKLTIVGVGNFNGTLLKPSCLNSKLTYLSDNKKFVDKENHITVKIAKDGTFNSFIRHVCTFDVLSKNPRAIESDDEFTKRRNTYIQVDKILFGDIKVSVSCMKNDCWVERNKTNKQHMIVYINELY